MELSESVRKKTILSSIPNVTWIFTAVNFEHKPDSILKKDAPFGRAMFQAGNKEEIKVCKWIDISYLIAKLHN